MKSKEVKLLNGAKKAGEVFGTILVNIIILSIISTIIWLALVYLVGFEVAWLKVFGVYFIFDFIKNIINQDEF